jgi:large subunit ribosomal protein L9
MKVILKKDVRGIGRIGDTKDVADGYARNYLIPYGLAVQVNTYDAKIFIQQIEKMKRDMDKKVSEVEDIKRRLEESVFSVKVKVGEGDKMFGSIMAKDIAMLLKEAGYDIDRKDVFLSDPIKSLGMYEVEVKIWENIKGKVKIRVEKE